MLKIVRVDFPFTDDPSHSKIRPALCLTKPHGRNRLVVLAYMTTNTNNMTDTDILLNEKDDGFKKLRLKKSTVIKLHRLVSISADKLNWELSPLPKNRHKEVQKSLCKLFKLKNHA